MALLKSFVAKSPTIWLSMGIFYLAMQCLCFITTISSVADEPTTGEFLDKKKCSASHPDAKKITVQKGIIELMGNPPPYRPAFIEIGFRIKMQKKLKITFADS